MFANLIAISLLQVFAFGPHAPFEEFRELGIVRVSVAALDGHGRSYSTGTHLGHGLIVTCGHCAETARYGEPARIDLLESVWWTPDRTVNGKFVYSDPHSDLGLIQLDRGHGLTTQYQLAPRGYSIEVGDEVIAYDWSHGATPERLYSVARHVTHVNRYLGPSNIETTGQPLPGSSGGPLILRKNGLIIGVTSGALIGEDRGLYTGLEAIYQALDATGFRQLIE